MTTKKDAFNWLMAQGESFGVVVQPHPEVVVPKGVELPARLTYGADDALVTPLRDVKVEEDGVSAEHLFGARAGTPFYFRTFVPWDAVESMYLLRGGMIIGWLDDVMKTSASC